MVFHHGSNSTIIPSYLRKMEFGMPAATEEAKGASHSGCGRTACKLAAALLCRSCISEVEIRYGLDMVGRDTWASWPASSEEG